MKGKIIVNKMRDLVIHTYVSPEETFEVTSHIIETKKALIIIDAQFFMVYAQELCTYISGIEKPVECLIISHAHPDHWFGASFFKDCPVISLKEIVNDFNCSAADVARQVQAVHKEKVVAFLPVISPSLSTGNHIMGGINVCLSLVAQAEGENHLLINLPDYNVLVAQDLAYNQVHLFLGDNHHNNWLNEIEKLKSLNDDVLVLAGHGEPTTLKVFSEVERYLNKAKEIIAHRTSSPKIKESLVGAFNDYKSAHLIDISNDYLFHSEHVINEKS